MKRLMAILGAAFMWLIFAASPAHALQVVVATIFAGEVRVIGIQAKKSANISWEGNVVTTSNKGGVFKFGTTDLPLDCVGELSDGVTTIDVVVFGCTTTIVNVNPPLATGQTTSFQTGDDGDLELGTARSYTDNLDGTITDNVTGLMWEKLTDDSSIHDKDNTYTWANAFAVKIAALNTPSCFAGHCDWRLPNVNELQTLADYGLVSPAIDPAFNNGTDSFTKSDAYWSSTTFAFDTSSAWFVAFTNGFVSFFGKTVGIGLPVRAVRGP
jgi:hypothetical protein